MNPPAPESESPPPKNEALNISKLIDSVKTLGFRKVLQKEEKVVFGIDISKTEEEKQYFIYDVELFCKQNLKYQCLRSYFCIQGHFYRISKTYSKYILDLINLINSKLLIGGFFFEDSTNLVYYEINQLSPHPNLLNRSTQKLLDELVSSMTFSKTFYHFIQYLKSIKRHFNPLLKKASPLPAGLLSEISKTIENLVLQDFKIYLEKRAKDINMNRAHLNDPHNEEGEIEIIRTLKTDERLLSLFILDKYTVKDSKVVVPMYRLGKGFTKGIFFSSKSFVLAERILSSPKLLSSFQDFMFILINKGFKINLELNVEKFRKIVSSGIENVVNDDLFYNFIVTSDDKINFAYDENRQLTNSLVKIQKNSEEALRAKQEIIESVFETSMKVIENLNLDLSILDKDINSYIEKINN